VLVEKRGEKFSGELVKSAKEEKTVAEMVMINTKAFTSSTLFLSQRGVEWKIGGWQTVVCFGRARHSVHAGVLFLIRLFVVHLTSNRPGVG